MGVTGEEKGPVAVRGTVAAETAAGTVREATRIEAAIGTVIEEVAIGTGLIDSACLKDTSSLLLSLSAFAGCLCDSTSLWPAEGPRQRQQHVFVAIQHQSRRRLLQSRQDR